MMSLKRYLIITIIAAIILCAGCSKTRHTGLRTDYIVTLTQDVRDLYFTPGSDTVLGREFILSVLRSKSIPEENYVRLFHSGLFYIWLSQDEYNALLSDDRVSDIQENREFKGI